MEKKENIIKKLSLALSPLFIEVEDQSHLHAGHNEAAKNGGTHFKISIKSSKFNNIKPIDKIKNDCVINDNFTFDQLSKNKLLQYWQKSK